MIFQGVDSLHVAAETFYSGLHDFTLVSIPMFIMMGAAIGSSPAGKRPLRGARPLALPGAGRPGDLQSRRLRDFRRADRLVARTLRRHRQDGHSGDAQRGYPDDVATGSICAGGTLGILIPPSITFILYGIATETSIGRLFLAGVMPGLMLTGLFMLWTLFIIWKRGFRAYAAGLPL